ncbi:hypothetical protein [Lysobacter gummosus]|uniref:hypothetical protein n=1 Tax=Lysobacter gummosus TaxID=262324 RepID=UPI0036403DB9
MADKFVSRCHVRGHYFRQGEARMRVLRLFKVPASSFEDLRLFSSFPRRREGRPEKMTLSSCSKQPDSRTVSYRHSRERGLRFTSAEPNIQCLSCENA